jgi:hypothetical protein
LYQCFLGVVKDRLEHNAAAIFTRTDARPFFEGTVERTAFGKTQLTGNIRQAKLGVAE